MNKYLEHLLDKCFMLACAVTSTLYTPKAIIVLHRIIQSCASDSLVTHGSTQIYFDRLIDRYTGR